MKQRFFHQERGKTLGPVTIEEIKSRIRSGRIRMFDLVFKDGEDSWKMALEFSELRADFKASAVKTLAEKPWVCLQRKNQKSLEFITQGPYTTEEIRAALASGRISYSDYVWREGYEEWKRIGTIEDFNRRLRERPEPPQAPPLPEIPAADLLKNVVEMKRARVPQPEPEPPEAKTNDLTKKDEPPRKRPPKADEAATKIVTPRIPDPEPQQQTQAKAPEELPPEVPRKKKKKRRRSSLLLDWGVVLLLAVVLCLTVLFLSRYAMKKPLPDTDKFAELHQPELNPPPADVQPPAPPPQPVTPKPEARQPQPEKTADAEDEQATPKNEKQTPPTELVLNVQAVNSNQVRIEIRSDAGSNYPVYVQIVGLPGQVTEGASFYKFMKITPKGDSKKPLDLSGLKLPQGRFILRAQTGDLKKEKQLAVGVTEAAFKQTVARLRKMYAYSVWKERLALFAMAQAMEKKVGEALAGKKFDGRGFEALNAVKRTNGGNYVLFEQWWELKELLADAKSDPNMVLLGKVKQAREKLSTFSVWK